MLSMIGFGQAEPCLPRRVCEMMIFFRWLSGASRSYLRFPATWFERVGCYIAAGNCCGTISRGGFCSPCCVFQELMYSGFSRIAGLSKAAHLGKYAHYCMSCFGAMAVG